MLIGYARVSTDDQNLALQNDALEKSGCEKIFSDTMSGAKATRPGLDECMDYARPGYTIVVWRLDRLGRSLKDLIALINILDGKAIGMRSLNEMIDTSSSSGKLIFYIFGALAEFECNLIRERIVAGLEAARARGKVGGRPKKLVTNKLNLMRTLYSEKKYSIKDICDMVGISKQTLYNNLHEETTS